MANLLKWTVNGGVGTPSFDALLSTGLNSLANGSNALSGALTNSSDIWTQMDLSLLLASLTPSAGGYTEAHLCYLNQNGTNYEDIGINTLVGVFNPIAGASAKYMDLKGILIAPRDFKVGLVNSMGVSFASSGNVLKGLRYAINGNA